MSKKLFDDLNWYSKQNINLTFKNIASEVLKIDNFYEVISISQLAKQSNTTATSITRFCNKLGFNGYKEMFQKLRFENEHGLHQISKDVHYSNEGIYWNAYDQLISHLSLITHSNSADIDDIANLIYRSTTIYFISSREIADTVKFLIKNLIALGFAIIELDSHLFDLSTRNINLNLDSLFIFQVFGEDNDAIFKFYRDIISKNLKTAVISRTIKYKEFLNSQTHLRINIVDAVFPKRVEKEFYLYYIYLQILNLIKNKI